jgi:tagatose 6-phosphate kinase
MILTVTLNPALDITYRVPSVHLGETHRVTTVRQRAGGKGVNVARVLAELGEEVLATGLAGSPVRRTVVVTDGVEATGFWEPGPRVTSEEWAAFQTHYAALVGRAAVVVLSGSVPPGVPVDAYADLIRAAQLLNVPSILDTSGPAPAAALARGVRAGTAWPQLLADAVALAAAAVAAPVADAYDPGLYSRLRAEVTVEKTP